MGTTKSERKYSRVKLFYGEGGKTIESQLNKWLAQEDGTWNTVHNIQFLERGSGVLLAFVYYTPSNSEL